MRDCKKCKHLVMYDYKNRSYSCESGECEFEPVEQELTTKNNLDVDIEDAVERLNAIKQFIGYDKDSEIVKATQKSLDMAIKALEQEPVLDKIKGQIKDYLRGVEITLEVLVENDPLRPKMEGAKDTLEECLELIDKAEKEQE